MKKNWLTSPCLYNLLPHRYDYDIEKAMTLLTIKTNEIETVLTAKNTCSGTKSWFFYQFI